MNVGTLYIVATPIGNLEDLTLRALRILREVDLIAAEDTRHSRKLLTHFGISKPLTSYFDHNKNIKGAQILAKLKDGLSVALISDAGTPCISDPGYQLVRDAVASGIRVVPVPGACAAMAALSASGLPTDSFAFEGFLPSRPGKRRERLAALKGETRVMVFHEAPTRLAASLDDVLVTLGDREMVLARELTKVYEEFLRGKVSEVIRMIEGRAVKGEIVLLIAPAPANDARDQDLVPALLERYLDGECMSVKDAVKRVSEETGESRSRVYQEALKLGKNK
ncbi:MAG: 16S rRNA (cytidine(1402)-2'-O)-methyltransferase [Geobacteraceae bacterium]|nr:16S rRNA (cytidine(1402)-2'-O)-methyltransferase [Geobacteraceae bacterium]